MVREQLQEAKRLRDEALSSAKRMRQEALAEGKRLRKEALSTAKRSRDEALRSAFEPLTPQRRREMTREHLLEAAAIVFARDGFHRASLDDIAALAGFTKGAVYSNFKSK